MLPYKIHRQVVYLTALELQIVYRFANDLGLQRRGFSAALRFILQDWDALQSLAASAPGPAWQRLPPLPGGTAAASANSLVEGGEEG